MNEQEKPDKTRRALLVAPSAVGAVAGVAAAVPFVASMWPSERARAAGAPVEVDLTKIAPGTMEVVERRCKRLWIIRRTQEILASHKSVEARLSDPASKASDQPKYAQNEYRSAKPEYMIMESVCTHLGCSPHAKPAD